ncbi:hypothetical protein VTL71DRAFT_13901 [Oculimacula yallundae]|uniref:Uncharacterized protein n=1 Tax=Oculimacula yallundae TaxID=86028 RepID=A0ABR4CLR3_9HELO
MPLFSSSPDQKRRKSSTTNPQPAMLAYRDDNNTSIAYSSAQPHTQHAASDIDSDHEALIQPASQPSQLSDHDKQHFTATGRPQPAFKSEPLANLGGHMYTMPQLLPKRYTDDSIIPAIITDVIPAQKVAADQAPSDKKGLSLLNKFKSKKEEKEKDKIMKVVYMPRREYQKFFARDEKGNYVGSEEHRRWTEEELEQTFAQYKPNTTEKKTGLFSGTGGTGTKTGGALGAIAQGLS